MPLVLLDGTTILLPDSATQAIELLRKRFGVAIEYGCGREWEFANKARAAGVSERLVQLGHVVQDVSGVSVEDMVRAAITAPEATYADWSALYFASMEMQ
ncbi:hypothetical protein [Mycetohabitans sp. B46]|uniref:hypothetical protein n=1 Tax=Mycetohabitans sp. B46 TaxID=2772536 RepID=UPI00307DF98D